MCASHFSRNSLRVIFEGGVYVPSDFCEISAEHSTCASRLPFACSLCQTRLRCPVVGSFASRTAYQLPLPRSRMCPFISSTFLSGGGDPALTTVDRFPWSALAA